MRKSSSIHPKKPRRGTANLIDPRNFGVVGYILAHAKPTADIQNSAPSQLADPYYDLGCHPDLVELLWDKLPAELPEVCRWVVAGTPVLVRPGTGIIFAFGGGTHVIGLRLPPEEVPGAVAAGATLLHEFSDGSTLDARTIGPEWVLIGWHRQGPAWCRMAYDFAGKPK